MASADRATLDRLSTDAPERGRAEPEAMECRNGPGEELNLPLAGSKPAALSAELRGRCHPIVMTGREVADGTRTCDHRDHNQEQAITVPPLACRLGTDWTQITSDWTTGAPVGRLALDRARAADHPRCPRAHRPSAPHPPHATRARTVRKSRGGDERRRGGLDGGAQWSRPRALDQRRLRPISRRKSSHTRATQTRRLDHAAVPDLVRRRIDGSHPRGGLADGR